MSWPVEKFQAIIVAALSVLVASAIIYEIAYFAALLISIRAVPLTVSDYSSEIVRLAPLYGGVGAIGAIMYVTLHPQLTAIHAMFRIHQKITLLNARLIGAPYYEQSRISRKTYRLWLLTRNVRRKILRARKVLVGIFTGLMAILGICAVIGPAISSQTADPIYSIYSYLGASSALIGASFGLLYVLKENRFIGFILLVGSSCWLITAWASYVALSDYDQGQAATIVKGTTLSNVRIVGSFEKGLLIRDKDTLRFVFWNEVDEVTYPPANKADILEPWLQSVKVPYDNPLKSAPK